MNVISRGFNKVAVPATLIGMGLLALTPGLANADILPSAGSPVVTPVGALLEFDYSVFVTTAQEVKTGDLFRIYDFAGLQAGLSVYPTATFTQTVANADAPVLIGGLGTIIPLDDPSLPNVTFTYSGPTILGGPTTLGTFSLFTTAEFSGLKIRPFVGEGTDQVTGLPNGNITNTFGPAAVPEPGSIALMVGMGISGSAFFLRRRKASK